MEPTRCQTSSQSDGQLEFLSHERCKPQSLRPLSLRRSFDSRGIEDRHAERPVPWTLTERQRWATVSQRSRRGLSTSWMRWRESGQSWGAGRQLAGDSADWIAWCRIVVARDVLDLLQSVFRRRRIFLIPARMLRRRTEPDNWGWSLSHRAGAWGQIMAVRIFVRPSAVGLQPRF